MTTDTQVSLLLYVGTYTEALPHVDGMARGIGAYRFDTGTGALTPLSSSDGPVNPSYLALHPHGPYLYSVEETAEGRVHAFRIDPASGALTPLGSQSAEGAHPAHLSIDRDGRWLLVANYTSGTIAVLPIAPDGSLGAVVSTVQHHGHGLHRERQEGPHAHWIGTGPSGGVVFVADLGLDAVLRYRFDTQRGTLTALDPCPLPPGSGPRHLAFHPNGHHAYAINELDATVVACTYDAEAETLRPEQSLSALPTDLPPTESFTAAAIRVAPSGRFVYASVRGPDTIAIFACDPQSGLLTASGHVASQGRTPRDIAIDPSGTYLVAANQDSDTIVSHRIDRATGLPTPIEPPNAVATPACLTFYQA